MQEYIKNKAQIEKYETCVRYIETLNSTIGQNTNIFPLIKSVTEQKQLVTSLSYQEYVSFRAALESLNPNNFVLNCDLIPCVTSGYVFNYNRATLARLSLVDYKPELVTTDVPLLPNGIEWATYYINRKYMSLYELLSNIEGLKINLVVNSLALMVRDPCPEITPSQKEDQLESVVDSETIQMELDNQATNDKKPNEETPTLTPTLDECQPNDIVPITNQTSNMTPTPTPSQTNDVVPDQTGDITPIESQTNPFGPLDNEPICNQTYEESKASKYRPGYSKYKPYYSNGQPDYSRYQPYYY